MKSLFLNLSFLGDLNFIFLKGLPSRAGWLVMLLGQIGCEDESSQGPASCQT